MTCHLLGKDEVPLHSNKLFCKGFFYSILKISLNNKVLKECFEESFIMTEERKDYNRK